MDVQVVHNKVCLDIDLQDKRIQGWCVLTCKAKKTCNAIEMHAGEGIVISGIRVDGVECPFNIQTDTIVAESNHSGHPFEKSSSWPKHSSETPNLIINNPIEADMQYSVQVSFQVKPDSPNCFYSANPNTKVCNQVALLSTNDHSRHWLPGIDTLSSRCRWDFELSLSLHPNVPHEHAFVVASGALIQQVYDEGRRCKVFSYKLDMQVPACKIGVVAGWFEMHKVHGIPNAHIFTPYQTITAGDRIGPTVDFLTRTFGYLNWLLNTRYPWAGFYLVFAKEMPRTCTALPNLVLLPTALLHDHRVIDQTWETRQWLCSALIEQYYFCKFVPTDRRDRWIVPALCRYLSFHQLRVFHGNNEYRLQVRADLESVIQMTQIVKRPLHHPHHPFELDPHYSIENRTFEWLSKKGRLVLVMLEQCIGKQNIQKILMQIFIDANATEDRAVEDLYTITYLQRCIKRITGKEMRGFLEQWLMTTTIPRFEVSFSYNRKKSCVEFNVSQSTMDDLELIQPQQPQGRRKPAMFTGPLLIRIHETDTAYDHSVHIEDQQHHFELPFHTKVRKPRQTKNKTDSQVPEDDGGQTALDSAASSSRVSPVSWIRIDPEIEWIADISIQQPDVMWIEQLENDRDVIAQYDAIKALCQMPSEATCLAFEKTIADFKAFHRVRSAGLVAMASCSTAALHYAGARKLLDMFSRRFGLRDPQSGEILPRKNDFENLSNYYLFNSIPEAIGALRDQHGACPEQALQLLVALLRYNDNSANAYSDYDYLCKVMAAIESAFPTITNHQHPLINQCLEELDRYAYLERILPSHRNAVMVAVLRALRGLQLAGLCAFPMATFQEYLQFGHYLEVRMAAAVVIADLFPMDSLEVLLECFVGDESMAFRRAIGVLLAQRVSVLDIAGKDRLYKMVLARPDCDELQSLSERLYPDQVITATTQTSTSTIQPIIIASPVKRQPVKDEADWVSEISEGQPQTSVISVKRDTSSFSAAAGTSSASTNVAVPKLRLAVGTSTRSEPSLAQRCEMVIDSLWEHPDSYPFRYPVDPSVPHYYDIIRQPMDLSTLRQLCPTITTPHLFLRHLRLVFDNCFQFNHPQSMIYAQAKELRKQAVKEAKRVFVELKGEVRELIAADLPIDSTVSVASSLHNPTVPMECRFEQEDKCRQVLTRLKQTPQAFWFLNPVDPIALGIPTYFDIIKEPMDFGTIAGKLETNSYSDRHQFLRDLKLVFTNCYRFNHANDPVCEDAKLLEGMVVEVFGGDYTSIDVTAIPVSKPVLKLKLAAVKNPNRDFEEPCKAVLQTLQNDPQSGPFLKPVVGVPNYSKLIKHPMDLTTINAKLSRHAYPTAQSVKHDLDQIWQNCERFNGVEAPITAMARHLSELTEHLFNEYGL